MTHPHQNTVEHANEAQQHAAAAEHTDDTASVTSQTSAEAEASSNGVDAETSDKLVPVTEAIRYRKRAQAAEQKIGDLNTQLEQLQQQLDEAQHTVTHLERRQQIDALLAEAEAIDLETARLLTERAVEQMSEPDVSLAVDELRRNKPYLFQHSTDTNSGAMAARDAANVTGAEQAAEHAARSGDRRDLLHYLRLRRQTQ